jgi:peptidoglycan/LPS O-acetylase OafA/YrhL
MWSLANEFWYYALFPCLVIALTKDFSWTHRVIAAIVMVALALFIGKWMLGEFLIWLLGVALIFLPRPHGLKSWHHSLFLATSFLFVIVQLILTFDPRKIEGSIDTDYILAVVVTIFIYALLHHPQPVSSLYKKIARQAAGFSYTLYLTHMPVLVFFSAWLNHRNPPTTRNFLLPLAILCGTIAYSYGIAMIFEHNTDRIRKRLETKFGL